MNWPRTWKDASGGTYKSCNKGKLALYVKVNFLACLNTVLSFLDYHVCTAVFSSRLVSDNLWILIYPCCAAVSSFFSV